MFHTYHKFHSLFNINNVKVSYSCTKNKKSIFANRNKTILDESETSNKKKCNCIYKNICSLNGECQAGNIIYQASLNSNKRNYDENITRVVVKSRLKIDLPIIKNHLTTTYIKTKRNFQRKYGILSQQITTHKLLGKPYADATL